jgi:hypothetical protein
MLQMPVLVPSTGLKQGAQRSVVGQPPCGRKPARDAAAGMHSDAQRPSPPATEVQRGNATLPFVETSRSGRQTPPLSHFASWLAGASG